jgi:hypothetical protein
MKIQDLTANPKNPRIVTDEKLEMLRKSILSFGDLSGIIYNRKTKQLVGGHQRTKILDGPHKIVIAKKYAKPTKAGTLADGYVEAFGERFVYREVSWSSKTEKAANIAANKGAGTWDDPQLTEWLSELALDSEFDMDLTMFDVDERDDFLNIDDSDDDAESTDKKPKPGVSRLEHECPECGHKFTNGDE